MSGVPADGCVSGAPADGDRPARLARALHALEARLTRAASDAGRARADLTLVAVTKFFPAADVAALAELGCADVGESRDQEASEKAAAVEGPGLRWHMVGTVQRNKARSVARWAHAVHSADSVRLVDALARGAAEAVEEGRRSGPLRVFVQVSLDGDTGRGGVAVTRPDEVEAVCSAVADATHLELAGLMGIPPRDADADRAFSVLQDAHRRVLTRHPGAVDLSAGMSGDLESAVRHGATVVRVGTALMGQRPLASR